ncbi:hypothetical protein [Gemmiger sp. An120]|uniref:hypothetical protein n=1 Tax=Gemmiger sp. An120 TaxID=1965549 RepID=UPI00117B4AC4|nr:hypothetical protein [Gemmiger sp. An120]
MDSNSSKDPVFREWYCPIYKRKIDEGLCFEIANIGCDLPFPLEDKPPCDSEEALKYCKNCPHYAEWD